MRARTVRRRGTRMEEGRELAVTTVTARLGGRRQVSLGGDAFRAVAEDGVEPPCFSEQTVRLGYWHLLVVLTIHLESGLVS